MDYPKTLELLLQRYPPYQDAAQVRRTLEEALASFERTIVVLDDDPTGTQTVRELPVVTNWETETLRRELERQPRMLFILTNSRSLSSEKTRQLHTELAENLVRASRQAGREFLLVSRGDSTLRGHFPLETETLRQVLENETGAHFDGEILCPFFPEGGRYTAGDIHYLTEGERLIPVGESEFAKDPTFGYESSHLGAWVEEKTGGAYPASGVHSVTLEQLRSRDHGAILETLCAARNFQKIIVNAVSYEDLRVFVPVLYEAMGAGHSFMLRTASAILKVMSGCSEDTVCTREELLDRENPNGGLVIAGSHVKKATGQLASLRASGQMEFLEFNQHLVLEPARFEAEITRVSEAAERLIRSGKHVLVATRRQRLDLGNGDKEAELALAERISQGLVQVVSNLQSRPSFVVAKGGITSSDVATKGLKIRRATVLGQILPGIPVWRCGAESRFPGLVYVVFPGNVGGETALLESVRKLIP